MANTTEHIQKLWHILDEKKYSIPSWIWAKWDGQIMNTIQEIEEILDAEPGKPIRLADSLKIQDKAIHAAAFVQSIERSVGVNVLTADKIIMAEEICGLSLHYIGNDLQATVSYATGFDEKDQPPDIRDLIKVRIASIREFVNKLKSKTK